MQSRTSVKLAAASAVGVLSLVGSGYAAAATGSLPGTAQQTARDALATVSDLATTTDLEGADKGAAVSGLASDGLSKAGSRPTPPTTTSAATPAPSGTAAGSAATGADASDGRSTAGAGNADTRRP